MKFSRLLLLLAGVLAGIGSGQAQVFDWAHIARQVGPRPNYAVSTSAGATDGAGNTYTLINLNDSVRLGTQLYLPANGNQLLAKYDSAGQVQWVKQLRNLAVAPHGVAVSPSSGAVFVLASAAAAPTWGGTPVATGGQPFFYARVSGAGALVWVRPMPALVAAVTAGFELGFTADDQGSCYLMSRMRRPSVFNGLAVDTISTFLCKIDGAGTLQWLRRFQTRYPSPNTTVQAIGTIALGPKPGGGCVVVGLGGNPSPAGTVYYGPTATVAIGAADGYTFVANIDGAGNFLWLRRPPAFTLQNPAFGDFYAATADAAGNCYATGHFGNGGLGVVKYTAAGAVQWTRYTTSPGPGFNGAGTHVVVDGAGNVTVLCGADFETGPNAIPPHVLGALTLRSHLNVVRFGPTGQEQWAVGDVPGPLVQFGTSGLDSYFLNQAGALGLDRRGNVYYSAVVLAPDTLQRGRGAPTVRLGAQTVSGRGVVVARIGTRHDLLTGRAYLDANGNGLPDAGEGPLPFPLVLQAVQAGLTALGTPEAGGRFTVYTDSGAYQLAAPYLPDHYTLTQPGSAAYTGRLVGYGRTDSLRHFGVRPVPNQADLRATLTPYSGARPGFVTRYRLRVENRGTTAVAGGTATATLDGRMAYVSSTPAGSRAGQTVSWTYGPLAPFARFDADVLFSLPVSVPVGTVLNSAAAAPLAADVVPADNTAALAQTVTGSFDPNDMEVNYQRLTPTQLAAHQPLDYTVRFQNVGTDTAFAVVISDTLDFRKLNVASLLLVAQSHSCNWSLSSTGLLTVHFLNIKLPYRNVDVIRSQGFVRFRVQPKTTLAVGEIIPNHASIVFDFNAPVRTNTATTTVLLASAALAQHAAAAWTAYPNPATDAVTIAANLATAGPVRLELLDVLGRPVRQQTLTAPAGPLRQALDLRGLTPGMYLLRLTPPTGPATSHPVVRE